MSNNDEGFPSGSLLIGAERPTGIDSMDHVNATTGRVQASFAMAGPDDVSRAVATARDAAPGWATWDPVERRNVLLGLADLIDAARPELTRLAALESGSPVGTGSGGRRAAEYLRYYAGWIDKFHGETLPVPGQEGLDYTLREPVGVVAVLIPWNGPITSIGQKVAPALAAGNAVVLKPSELAPFAALRFGVLCLEAGIPAGVVNVIPGAADTGRVLVAHPGVDTVSFTGSPATGRAVMAAAAESLTPVVLELGGKSALVAFADADVDTVVATAVRVGLITAAGQGCVLPTRLMVEAPIYDEVLSKVVDVATGIALGDPLDPETVMGPVVSAQHRDRIIGVIERAVDENAGHLVLGGGRPGGDLADGAFVEPTVFADVDPASHLAQNEVFGPVQSVLRFDGEEEALRMANSTRYGLGAFVYTNDLGRAHRVAAGFEAGYVGVNAFPNLPPTAPFGGVKDSGFGREGGRAGLDPFLRIKNVFVGTT
ncbi:MAG: aldehyde dehydrogenase family protein [Acidimicrobiia bacterium]